MGLPMSLGKLLSISRVQTTGLSSAKSQRLIEFSYRLMEFPQTQELGPIREILGRGLWVSPRIGFLIFGNLRENSESDDHHGKSTSSSQPCVSERPSLLVSILDPRPSILDRAWSGKWALGKDENLPPAYRTRNHLMMGLPDAFS